MLSLSLKSKGFLTSNMLNVRFLMGIKAQKYKLPQPPLSIHLFVALDMDMVWPNKNNKEESRSLIICNHSHV